MKVKTIFAALIVAAILIVTLFVRHEKTSKMEAAIHAADQMASNAEPSSA